MDSNRKLELILKGLLYNSATIEYYENQLQDPTGPHTVCSTDCDLCTDPDILRDDAYNDLQTAFGMRDTILNELLALVEIQPEFRKLKKVQVYLDELSYPKKEVTKQMNWIKRLIDRVKREIGIYGVDGSDLTPTGPWLKGVVWCPEYMWPSFIAKRKDVKWE